MKVISFEDNDQWMAGRLGKITGTRLKDLIVKRGTGKKIGYYEIIAERLAVPADGENCMDRGHRLEEEAIQQFEEKTGKKVDTSLVIWERDDNSSIAISPDGFIGTKEALEVKCLASARHIEALLTDQVPKDYYEQTLQYFIVNDDLEVLHVILYDPRIMYQDYIQFDIKREDVAVEVAEYLELERKTIEEINEIVLKLSDF